MKLKDYIEYCSIIILVNSVLSYHIDFLRLMFNNLLFFKQRIISRFYNDLGIGKILFIHKKNECAENFEILGMFFFRFL